MKSQYPYRLLRCLSINIALASASISGPKIKSDFPDPSIIKVSDTYYAYGTQGGTSLPHVHIATSKDFQNWEVLPEDPLPDTGDWNAGDFVWAPSVQLLPNNSYAMFYSARMNPSSTDECIGVAVGDSPKGPFHPNKKSVACPPGSETIDPQAFTDKDGKSYLLYKETSSRGDFIKLQTLHSDGVTFLGPATNILNNTEPWDRNVVEAPSLVHVGNIYFLTYSTSGFDTPQYTTSVARASHILGPYTQQEEPLLQTKGSLVAPGGATMLYQDIDESGSVSNVKVVFHAYDGSVKTKVRQMWTGIASISGSKISLV